MSFLSKLAGRSDSDQAVISNFDDMSIHPDHTVMPVRNTTQQLNESIYSAVAPSDADLPEPPRVLEPRESTGGSGLPLIGRWPLAAQRRAILTLIILSLAGLAVATALSLRASMAASGRTGAVGQALMQSQRLAKSVSSALLGTPSAFAEVNEAREALVGNVNALRAGDAAMGVSQLDGAAQDKLEVAAPLVDRASKQAGVMLNQQKVLIDSSQAIQGIGQASVHLAELAEGVATAKLAAGPTPAEVGALTQLTMLPQRIGKSASEFLTVRGIAPEAAFSMGKDLNAFRDLANGLLDGSESLKLAPTTNPDLRVRLGAVLTAFGELQKQSGVMLSNLQGLVLARDAQAGIVADSEPLRKALEGVQGEVVGRGAFSPGRLALFLVSLVGLALGAWAWMRHEVTDQRRRAVMAEMQTLEAGRLEREAKRVNDANQAAILRLMNELQVVAEGDLTQQATVTEDITGAIADSVNYTVEELRTLVAQVQTTVGRVTDTTTMVESTSTELLAASDEQLREIHDAGESVLQMAGRINQVSSQAQRSAQVARQSLTAAEQGLSAVQNTIGGMNAIRDQIQETSKRIKRLGESSQEIGEITELISDITEQTNVLALNAAIQAASAGEAGRGFSVVAEEVQRLAERSADATRQIAALVKAIQTDTADAVAAMERSTQGVVEGAKLSDNAGTALGEIDKVSRQLAELIQQISAQTSSEAESANVVAASIQHIFAVTEQTGQGTRSTSQLVRELSRMADELRHSVARFKIA